MIYLLTVLLFFITLLCYRINDRDILAPSFAFSISFLFSAIWASAYSKNWSFIMRDDTFFVILSGVIVFIIVSQIVSFFYRRTHIRLLKNIKHDRFIFMIENWKLLLVILVEIIAISLTIYYKLRIMGGSLSSLMISMMEYRKLVYASDEEIVSIPTWLGLTNGVIKAGSFFFGYILVNNKFISKKLDIRILIIIGLAIVSALIGGGRGGVIDLIVSIIVFSVVQYYSLKGNERRFNIGIKRLSRIIIIAAIVVFSFQQMGRIVGRESNMDLFDYLAEYIGAEIVNLNIFMGHRITRNDIWGSQTFINLIRWIGPIIGMNNWYYQLDHPFHYVNGYNLGNVATIFHAFMYDFGYFGVVSMTGIMAFISQCLYERVKLKYFTSGNIILKLVYSYAYSTILLSFFSNKFYEKLLSKGFFFMLIYWGLYIVFSFRVKLGNRTNIEKNYIEDTL